MPVSKVERPFKALEEVISPALDVNFVIATLAVVKLRDKKLWLLCY